MTAECVIREKGLAVPLLDALDCQLSNYVEGAYGALFGTFGWFGSALTLALTIYVGLFAFQLILGRANLSLAGLVPRLVVIAIVLTMATRWGAYQTLVFDVLFHGSEELAGVLITDSGQSVITAQEGVIERLDSVLMRLSVAAGGEGGASLLRQGRPRTVREATQAALVPAAAPKIGGISAANVNLLWLSAGLLALGSVGMLIVAKVLLGVLLGVGPVFIVFGLFGMTRGLFEGWLKSVVSYGLVPVFTLVLTAGVLNIVEPLAYQIELGGGRGTAPMQPSFLLAIVSLVFGILMILVLRLANQLTGGWRLPGRVASRSVAPEVDSAPSATLASGADVNPRLAALLMSIERTAPISMTPPMTSPSRSESLAYLLPHEATGQVRVKPSRRPLGQSAVRAQSRLFTGGRSMQ